MKVILNNRAKKTVRKDCFFSKLNNLKIYNLFTYIFIRNARLMKINLYSIFK